MNKKIKYKMIICQTYNKKQVKLKLNVAVLLSVFFNSQIWNIKT